MTTAQVVERSVTVNNNSPIQDYVHPDDQTQPFDMTPGFKPFTVKNKKNKYFTDQLDATEMIADGPAGRKKNFKEQLHLEFNSTSSP